ncbi:hypothetical protein ACFFU9_05970 [Mariniflexile ostreae]|uniref:GxxExxY protein n=2 Tax=Mariniflexile ostreae TaxID=1520892 RepID=A0ABV5FA29_9FLAO
MSDENKNKYATILTQSISYLENRGYKNIKANLKGYTTPKSYAKVGSDITITPDIVAEKEGRKHYFELSLKSKKTNLLKSKWLFLNTLTALKSHRFRIITTRGHFQFTHNILEDIHLNNKKLIIV